MKKLILILILFSLTGCYNYKELNSLAIATGFAVDMKNDEYEVTILISNSQKKGSGDSKDSASAAVYRGNGKTIFEAIKDASMGLSKEIYISHIDILLLSEEVAENKTSEVIDFFFRYPQTRNEFLVAIAQGCNAGDLFDVTTPLETFPSQNISKNLEITNKLQGFTYTVTFNEFVTDLIEEGKNPILPTISIIGSVEEGNKDENIEQIEPKTYLKLGMMSVFDDSKLIGISNKDQSKGINFINDKVNNTLVITNYNDGNVVVELNKSSTETSVEIIDNKPKIKINIESTGSIAEVGADIKVDKVEVIEEIKKNSEEEIKRIVNEGINYSKELKTDLFGFGNLIYKKNHKLWKEIKENWETEMLIDTEVEINVKLELKTKGSIDNIIEVK